MVAQTARLKKRFKILTFKNLLNVDKHSFHMCSAHFITTYLSSQALITGTKAQSYKFESQKSNRLSLINT